MTQNSVAEERRQYGAQHFPPYRARRAALALELPPVIGDRMVLQTDTNVPVWGKAEPGAKVTVAFRGATLFNKDGFPALGFDVEL